MITVKDNVDLIRIGTKAKFSAAIDKTGGSTCSLDYSGDVFEFSGIAYQGLYFVYTKTYKTQPGRANDFAIRELNNPNRFKWAIIPRLEFNFKYFDIENYAKLAHLVAHPDINEFYVEAYDYVLQKRVCYPMYFEQEEQTKLFSAGGYLKGVLDYKVAAIGTLSNKSIR